MLKESKLKNSRNQDSANKKKTYNTSSRIGGNSQFLICLIVLVQKIYKSNKHSKLIQISYRDSNGFKNAT